MSRVFAAMYDRMLAASEEAGLRDARAQLLAQARGDVVEIGAGTGLNRDHYGPQVTSLTLTEPDPHMAKRMRDRVRPGDRVVEAPAEALPLPDESADTVVTTLVLCTVDDPGRAVAEATRILRPGGRLLFLEHVRAEDGTGLASWQDRLERPWGWVAGGCHPNRDTLALLRGSSLDVLEHEATKLPKAMLLVRPAVRGVAAKTAAL